MEQASFLFQEVPLQPRPVADGAVAEPDLATGPKILTVSEVVRAAKGLVEGAFSDVWMVGEVSGFRPSAAGHCYFDLKDESALIPAVCFRPVAQSFPFKMENGLELIVHGRFSIYEKSGKFQIIIDSAEPKGIGALQLAVEQLRQRLTVEGLFDPRHKKPLPFCPRRVGVVTSPTGAAIRDVINILRRRFPAVEVLLAPVRVQGEGAADEIAAAIASLDAQGACDVLIVGRGGGSIEDLWAFNEEAVARAIFAARTPIVSAVGHEIDFTIADFVADLRAPTPSAAAELVVPEQAELLATVRERQSQLIAALRRLGDRKGQSLSELRGRLKAPTGRFPDWLLQIDHCRERLAFGIRSRLERLGQQVQQRAAELNHLSPLTVLAKGYAVVCKNGTIRPVRDAAELRTGDRVNIRFSEGTKDAIIH
ncbi:MAG: exodeoxyribonuclease VII large subunit [Deltaproteobacteria bacterium]|nr:exodeoxyribonuclease VII large subunit [Deltaproteobacteria bacterium]